MARRKRDAADGAGAPPADPKALLSGDDDPELTQPDDSDVGGGEGADDDAGGDRDGDPDEGSDALNRPLNFDQMSDEEQAHYIESLEEQGKHEDAAVARSKRNASKRRDGSKTCELERIAPTEDDQGVPIGGLQKTFHMPFTDLSIREFTSRVLGGGLYQITYYDGRQRYMGRERFQIPGPPRLWSEQHKKAKEEEPPRSEPVYDDEPTPRELALEARLNQLTSMIAERDKRETEDRRDREHQAEIARLEEKFERLSATPKSNSMAETITAIGAALAPVMKALTDRTVAKDGQNSDVKAMLAAVKESADSTRTQMMDMWKMQGKASHPMDDALGKLVNTVILDRLQPKNDPQHFAFSMLNKIIPDAVRSSIEMAQAAASGNNNKDESIIERVFEMLGPTLEKAIGARAGAPTPGVAMPGMPGMPMLPYGATPMLPMPPGPMPPPGYGYPPMGYGYPIQQPRPMPGPGPGPGPVAVAGQWPYTQAAPAPPQPGVPYPQQPMAPQPVPQPPMMPTMPGMPIAPGSGPGAPGISPTGMVPGQQLPMGPMPGMPMGIPGMPMPGIPGMPGVPPAPVSNPAAAHINPGLFVLLDTFLQQGKTGDELAETVDDQIETVRHGQQAGPALLSEEAIEHLEEYPPELIATRIWEACPPELMLRFVDPTTGAVRPAVTEFVLDFCHYYYDDDEDEAEGADDAVAPGAPVAPVFVPPVP